MTILLYSLALHLYAFTIKCLSLFHKKARKMCSGQRQTNRILRTRIDRGERYIWFHAASLGEFEQGRPLIEKIKTRYPDCRILLTFFSPSGYEVRKNYPQADVVCYLPFDTPCRVRKFIRLANPCMAVFIKYEFWANYLFELKKQRIPAYCISAVFRPQQLFFKRYGRPYLRLLQCFDHLFVQDISSAELLARHGISRVTISGDTRFDRVMDVREKARRIPLIEAFVKDRQGGKLTLVAGSSWPQDEELIASYFNEHPDIRLIIAPHEIDRAHLHEIRTRLKRPSVLLSEADERFVARQDCLVIDTFGLLSAIYRYADIAYVGGGFGKGIHNVLEAAVYGIPVMFGPAHRKFKEAEAIINAGGGCAVANQNALNNQIDEWLANPSRRKAAGQAAGEFVMNHTGATGTILSTLSSLYNFQA